MNNIIKGIKLILSGLLSPFKSMNLLSNINNRIKECNNIHSHRIDTINEEIDFINHELAHLEDRDKVLSDRINNQLSLIRDIEDKLKATDVPVDLGEFNFINTADETDELLQIEAEMLGSSIAQEVYDWNGEKKALAMNIQDKMRADEAEYDRLSEPDKDNGVW